MPALERRDISREQGRARARGTVDSEGRCLVQSLREIDKESTTVSAQLGHRLFEYSHVVYTPKSPHLSSACRHPANSQWRKCLLDERSKEHISRTPSAYPLAARATVLLKIRPVLPGHGRFPVSHVSISAARFA